MKRMHIHIAVKDLADSVRFYSTLFGAAPGISKPDYAKWMLDDPRVNFAISQRGEAPGLNHLGVQVESADELAEMHARLEHLQSGYMTEEGASCCYANSDKYWAADPQDIAWETFHTLGNIPVFGTDHSKPSGIDAEKAGCCVPLETAGPKDAAPCCGPVKEKTQKREEAEAGTCC